MSHQDDRMILPPPRPAQRKARNNLLWFLITLIALMAGAVGGVWLGKSVRESKPSVSGSDPVPVKVSLSAELEQSLAEARIAIAERKWIKAARLYEEVLQADPENVEATTSLPLIEKHLQAANGSVIITTEPPGALVRIAGREASLTPAEIKDLPVGDTEVRIEKEGFETVTKTVSVIEEKTTAVPLVTLQKSRGQLELVSEPEGAEFKILKTTGENPAVPIELVQEGKTPAKVESLDAGEYEVHMAVDGWPDYSARIKVENNRSTSVSAVFARGGINVVSDPVGAEVWAAIGGTSLKKRGVTPLTLKDLPPGRHQMEVRYRDWAPIRRTVEVKGDITQNLEFSWERSMVTFHSDPEGAAVYYKNRRLGSAVTVTPFDLEVPEGDYLFEARYPSLKPVARGVYVEGSQSNRVDFPFQYGAVSIESDPPGAAVISNGIPVGRTPLKKPVVAPGKYTYRIALKKYKDADLSGVVEPGGELAFNTKLVADQSPAVTRNFTNGLNQKMIWFENLGGWVADTETLQSAYKRGHRDEPE